MYYLQYVNIKQGTKSVPRFSQGNTLPLLQRPFGFARFAPQTNSDRGAWFYHPEDRSFEGIRITHQPSPWIGDYGVLVFTAQSETPFGNFSQSWSGFDPAQAVMRPNYMRFSLKRPDAVLELTPTEYGCRVRAEFHRNCENFITVFAQDRDYTMEYDSEKNLLFCHARVHRNHETMALYTVFRFRAGEIDTARSFGESTDGEKTGLKSSVLHRAFHLAVDQKKIQFQIASSYIGFDQALQNLQEDSREETFDDLIRRNGKIWNDALSTVEIQAPEAMMRTFYSCMYRAFLFPHRAYEKDREGNPIHYAPALDAVRPGVRYTDNGFWDTYRTVYPFLSIVKPELYREMAEGFVEDYLDSGWLPRWTSGVACSCMPGTAIDAVIADGAGKGILKGKLLETAYEGMKKHATTPSPLPEYGRSGILEFEKLGYMPYDRYGESVNLTLDASYFDDCIASVAERLGKQEEAESYKARSQNYRNLYDPSTGFMRGKDSAGNFRPDFDPRRWGGDYTEAAAWQTSFAVQHDLPGLAELMGGKEVLLKKLDRLFSEKPDYLVGSYRQEIHEMTEMAACDWGQCAISNQPSFHIPYIYAFFGEPEKAVFWVRRACQEGFSAEDDGFPGDEDNGSMALWYVFAVMGIYPICPGKPVYTHIPPMAEKIRILGREVDLEKYGNTITHSQLMEEIYR